MKHLLYIGLLLGAFGCKSTKDSSVTSTKTAATVESPAFQTAFFDGQAAKTIEDYDRAYQAFERSVSISPNNSAPYYEMSRIDFMYDRTFQGLTNIRKALEISPDNYWYRKTYAGYLMELEKLEDAAFQWQKLIKADPEDIMSYHNLAMCYLFLDEEKSAIEVYNQLEKRMGLMPEISYQKQRLYLLSGDFEGALREVDKLIEAYPGEVEFIAQKAELLVELNRAQEAQALLESVVKEQPENGYAQLELSRIYAAQGKDSESFEALVKAFGAVEVDIDEKIGILLRYFEVSRFDDQAAKNANQLLEVLDKVHPNDPKTHSIYGDFLYRDERLEEAEMRFKKALELDPARPVLWNQLLSIELELRKWEAAAEHAGQAKDLYPTQPEFYIMEAHSFLQLKKYKDAIATLSIGKNFVVDNPSMLSQMHAMLGEAYNETKEFEKSDENFEKAIK
ncbi:MAG: hypothetical protein RL226_355, partial [Bacteroidota bacterium]